MENLMIYQTELFVNNYFPEEQDLINSNQNQYNDIEEKCFKYHYTNVESLKKILSTKKLRLMHYKYLNDTTEGKLIFDHLIKHSEADFVESLKILHQTIVNNFYVGSFSLFGNRLSQWRAYGNVCIGFDFNKMEYDLRFIEDLKGTQHVTSGLGFTKCDYIDTSIQDDINRIVEDIKNSFRDLSNMSLEDKSQFQYNALKLGLFLFGIKHIGFQEEHEYRIFHYLWKINPFKNERGKSYFNFIFKPEHVKRIVVGPSNQQDEIYKDIQKFKEQNILDYAHVEIYRSTIPFIDKKPNNCLKRTRTR